MSRPFPSRLDDVIAACEAIRVAEQHLDEAVSHSDVDLESVAFAAIAYQLIVIGEAIRDLPDTITRQRPDVPWSEAAAMPNVLAHEYFRVDPHVVHRTLDGPLAVLEAACRDLRP